MTNRLLRYFAYDHLPAHLQTFSQPFHALAHNLADTLSDGPELDAGLRKLLEAKDCVVRAALDTPPIDIHGTEQPLLVNGCEHCPDGHTGPAHGQPWNVRVGPDRDSDGRPIRLYVEHSAGAHVAESDVTWIYERLNGVRLD